MATLPITHHDIVRVAAPLRSKGLKIDLSRSNRSERYIEFETWSSFSNDVRCVYSLEIGESGQHLMTRSIIHDSGLISTLSVHNSNVDDALSALNTIPHERQIRVTPQHVTAHSYYIKQHYQIDQIEQFLELQYSCAHAQSLELRIDSSTGGSMPADVRLFCVNTGLHFLPEQLANGNALPTDHPAFKHWETQRRAIQSSSDLSATSAGLQSTISVNKLPDDFLAVLGDQWRPLRNQGDHWKGVLRTLGKHPKRTRKVEQFVAGALEHIFETLTLPPEEYHARLTKARWQVYVRRLQPLMLFLGILSLMPVSYLLVSRGDIGLHPLALGLTPLLMVGVVVMTAREIPVMEIPPKPRLLPSTFWITGTG